MRRSFVLCAAMLLAQLPGQELLWRLEGTGGQLQRGNELHRMGDVNGDGWDDVLERGVFPDPASPFAARNAIFLTSSQDGSILSVSPSPPVWSWNYWPETLAPLGDMDGDGVPDYAVTVYDAISPQSMQQLEVRSGANHSVLWTATIPNAWANYYAWTVAGNMDLDGDGLRDVVASASHLSPGGTLIVYDHFGNERYRIVDPISGVLVGVHLAPLGGDLDGDGHDDFLTAGPDSLNRGAVVLFSGFTGAVIRVSYGEQPGDKLSYATACGDMDGDGVLDYAGGGRWGYSVVTAFSGATGLPIHTWRDPGNFYMGIQVMGGFDVDQDGVNDLIAGQEQRSVNVLSGRDGTFLQRYFDSIPTATVTGIGWGQVLLAPPPGERYPLIVYSEREWQSGTNPATNNIFPGLLWCYRGSPDGVRAYGTSDASPGLDLPRSGVRDVTGPGVRFTLSSAPPSMPALLLLGASATSYGSLPLPAPLDALGMPGFTLLTAADAVGFAWTGSGGMANGYAALEPNVPTGMNLSMTGVSLFAQWLWFDPFDLSVGGSTAGQRFRLQ